MKDNLFLRQLVRDLYQRAGNAEVFYQLPVRVIDSPSLANHIFNNPEIFVKNYSFLEKLSQGRFSANGDDWMQRARLTQHFYHQSTHNVSDQEIYLIYFNNLKKIADKEFSFWECAIQSAVQVISLSYGLSLPIPWPADKLAAIMQCLTFEQTEAWLNPIDVRHIQNIELNVARQDIYDLWGESPHMIDFLESLAKAAHQDNLEYAKGELMQNLIAATETTASGFSWMVYCLGKYQDVQKLITENLTEESFGYFIDEVLRLFPPVPFVTRCLSQDQNFEGIHFQKGEHVLISIVGLHCHSDYWEQPFEFQFPRQEFVAKVNGSVYRPFISGPRVCGGMRLAKRELIQGLRAVLDNFRILPITDPPVHNYTLTSRPAISIDAYLGTRYK